MRIPALDPGTCPLSAGQAMQFNAWASTLTSEQTAWFLGYLTASHRWQDDKLASGPQPHQGQQLTVLYASQTGNAARLASQLTAVAASAGLPATSINAADYRTADLHSENYLVLIVSTHGEGAAPESAAGFYRFLFSKRAPRLEKLRFAILALGDQTYPHYCKCGADIDRRLEELGAERLLPRVDCDVDYQSTAAVWQEQVITTFKALIPAQGPMSTEPAFAAAATEEPTFSQDQPLAAGLLEHINLNGRGSLKQTVHLELSLADSGLTYQPGDALAVLPHNSPSYVRDVLCALGLTGDEPVLVDGKEQRMVDALDDTFEVTTITRSFLQAYAAATNHDELASLAAPNQDQSFRDYVQGREIIDVLTSYVPRGLSAQSFVGMLRRLQPRHYSIASSLLAHPEEVHLLVKLVRYQSHGRLREGVASGYLCQRLGEEAPIRVYPVPNPSFRLPRDPDAPIIMIGPGTGVAPFRAFVEERESLGCRGRNWLFFGDQHFDCDFLYQVEWQRWHKAGILSRIDLAFSRDQEERIYVQRRMLERAHELYAWLQQGAYVYVCGERSRMATDVHETLITIVAQEGQQDRETASAFIDDLSTQRRYLRDIY